MRLIRIAHMLLWETNTVLIFPLKLRTYLSLKEEGVEFVAFLKTLLK